MTSPLRNRRAEQLREDLRDRFLKLVLKKGLEGFTMQELADAAGVSVRTLYRYYPSREALTEAVKEEARRAQEKMEALRGPRDRTENPDFFATTFEFFEERADMIKASRIIRESGIDPPGARERTDDVRAWVKANLELHPEAANQLTGLLRLLGSTDAWLRLTEDDLALDSRQAGHAVQWAIDVLTEAAKEVDGPLRPGGKMSE